MDEASSDVFPRLKEQQIEREPKHVPYETIAEKVGLSSDRLRRLLNTGRVKGEKRRKKPGKRGYPWKWFTTESAVARYLSGKLTPREYGKRKPKEGKRRRGRPKKQERVIFQRSS